MSLVLIFTHRPRPTLRLLLLLSGLCVVFSSPRLAVAGGLARPNIVGARAVGMGGAYSAVADDALSIWHNPAGLARLTTADILFGTELVSIIRRYDPPDREDPAIPGGIEVTPVEKASMSPTPLPLVMGGARMLVGRNSFIALGLGVYNSFGGGVTFNKDKIATEGIIKSQIALFELAPAIAYQVHEKIFIGATLRVGLALFSALKSCESLNSCSHDPPGRPLQDTRVSTITGAGVGYSMGIQVLPTRRFGLGLTYRSNLDVTVSGKDAVRSGTGGLITFDAKVKLPFPQSLSLGAFFKAHERVLVAAQLGWVDNSRFRQIYIDIEGWTYGHDQVNTQLNMKDSFSAHLGTEILVVRGIFLRAGLAYDSQSIPNEYRNRSLADAHKMAWDLGATFRIGLWRIDFAAELMLGDLKAGFKSVEFPSGYDAPGRHYPGGTFSLHLGGGVAW